MTWLQIIALFVICTPLLAAGIIAVTFLLTLKMVRGRGSTGRELGAEETRLVQEIHQGLDKMDKRVEALETILTETERKKDDVSE